MVMIGGGGGASSKMEPGTYEFELVLVRPEMGTRGKWAREELGQTPSDPVPKLIWLFTAVESGEQIEVMTGVSTGEKTTFYSQIGPALNNGIAPCDIYGQVDTDVLIGRRCLGGVSKNAAGYSRITSFLPVPKGRTVSAPASAPWKMTREIFEGLRASFGGEPAFANMLKEMGLPALGQHFTEAQYQILVDLTTTEVPF